MGHLIYSKLNVVKSIKNNNNNYMNKDILLTSIYLNLFKTFLFTFTGTWFQNLTE